MSAKNAKGQRTVRGVVLPAEFAGFRVAAGRIDAYAWELRHETLGAIGELKVMFNDERLGQVGDRWYFWPADDEITAEMENSDPAVVLAAVVAYARGKEVRS